VDVQRVLRIAAVFVWTSCLTAITAAGVVFDAPRWITVRLASARVVVLAANETAARSTIDWSYREWNSQTPNSFGVILTKKKRPVRLTAK
jgi:hypothetical protein